MHAFSNVVLAFARILILFNRIPHADHIPDWLPGYPCPGLRKFRQWPGQHVDSLSLGPHHRASMESSVKPWCLPS